MIRTRKEWDNWCHENGTFCDMVYAILSDWVECTQFDAHEIWAAAQLTPDEGIEDGVRRIEELLGKYAGGVK